MMVDHTNYKQLHEISNLTVSIQGSKPGFTRYAEARMLALPTRPYIYRYFVGVQRVGGVGVGVIVRVWAC